MDRKTFEQQKAFAGSLKPSMLRRCLDHDYQGRCIYLITLVIEGRRPLFGELAGKSDGILGCDDEPRIILRPLEKKRKTFSMTFQNGILKSSQSPFR